MKTIILMACALLTGVGYGASLKMSADLANADPTASGDVIVQFTEPPTAHHHSKVTSRGGTLKRELGSIGAAYHLPMKALASLAADPEVVHISPDRPVHGTLDYTTAAVNASSAWNSNLTGAGIGVAVIDSGITATDDLPAARIVYSKSFVTGGTQDLFGHGTHVAGILGGSGQDSQCATCTRDLQGVAKGVNLVNLRVLDQNGIGSDSAVIAAIINAIFLKSSYNIKVINLSLGRPVFETYKKDPLCLAVEAAWKAGIVVVVAAGNDGRDNSAGTSGYGTISAPGNDPYAITVGAMKTLASYSRTDDLVASYSAKGPTMVDHILKPDLVAPGNRVVSVFAPNSSLAVNSPSSIMPLAYYNLAAPDATTPGNQYIMLSGTSMATPVVAGAAALLLQSDSTLTPDQVKARLMHSAYNSFPTSSVAEDPVSGMSYVSYYDAFTVGAGYLDINAALADTTPFSGTAMSPVVTLASGATIPSIICASTSICADQTLWGTMSIWPQQSLWGNQSLWGTQSLWGAQTLWGAQSLWGASSSNGAATVLTQGEQ